MTTLNRFTLVQPKGRISSATLLQAIDDKIRTVARTWERAGTDCKYRHTTNSSQWSAEGLLVLSDGGGAVKVGFEPTAAATNPAAARAALVASFVEFMLNHLSDSVDVIHIES